MTSGRSSGCCAQKPSEWYGFLLATPPTIPSDPGTPLQLGYQLSHREWRLEKQRTWKFCRDALTHCLSYHLDLFVRLCTFPSSSIVCAHNTYPFSVFVVIIKVRGQNNRMEEEEEECARNVELTRKPPASTLVSHYLKPEAVWKRFQKLHANQHHYHYMRWRGSFSAYHPSLSLSPGIQIAITLRRR